MSNMFPYEKGGSNENACRPLVVLRGNEITFHYDGEQEYREGQDHHISIRMYEVRTVPYVQ